MCCLPWLGERGRAPRGVGTLQYCLIIGENSA